ncbi:MAG: hypothetical protein Q7S89_02185 [bacterium]|nr:hypothetical protein [bacterium]
MKKAREKKCSVCDALDPDHLSEAVEKLETIASGEQFYAHYFFKRCPACGKHYFYSWEFYPYGPGNTDESLYLLSPEQVRVLKRFLNPPNDTGDFGYYVDQVGHLLSYDAGPWPIVTAFLYSFTSSNKDTAAAAYASLVDFVSEKKEYAVEVLKMITNTPDNEPWRPGQIHKNHPLAKKLVKKCKEIIKKR